MNSDRSRSIELEELVDFLNGSDQEVICRDSDVFVSIKKSRAQRHAVDIGKYLSAYHVDTGTHPSLLRWSPSG